MGSAGVELEDARLLPTMLVPADEDAGGEAGRARRSRRDWVVDIAAVAIALFFGAILLQAEAAETNTSDALVLADLGCGLLASALLWVRRRWPVGVGVAVALIGAFSVFAIPATVIAIFTVAVHRRFGVAAAVAALALATTPIYISAHPEANDPWWVSAVIAVLATGLVIAWGMFVRARRELVASLRERAHRAEAEQQLRVEQARQYERARIAREMHDVLAHRISLLSMHAGALEFRPDAPPGEIARAAGIVRASAHQALQDLREVIGVLREDTADGGPERPQPALTSLPALLDESRAAGMNVSFECRVEDLAAIPDSVGRNAYRIVQEGLTNARKHARGAAVEVAVDGAPGSGLTVEVRNRLPLNARAAEIPGTGTGLIGLAERSSLAGGRLEHGRTPAGDFQLRAWLPWPT
jgi:signal transduction histidine kinase